MAKSPRSLTHTLVDNLGQAIVCGTYSKENPFPIEAELCEQYDVSRSILREAVKMLTSKGLLGARPRQGTWIEPESNWNLLDPNVLEWLLSRKFSLETLIEFTEIRRVIEPQAAEYAALRASLTSMEKIEDGIVRMEAALKGDDDPLESEIAFYISVLEASGNRFFCQMKDLTKTALKISIRFANQYEKRLAFAEVTGHRNVAKAIRERDAQSAQRLMSTLLDNALGMMYDAKTEKEEDIEAISA